MTLGKKMQTMRHKFEIIVLLIANFIFAGCGHYPAPIRSAWSIRTTSASEYMVVIDGLPLSDWSKLDKFNNLQHFRLSADYASKVTDDHIIALSKIDFPLLRQVSLAHASQVTDKGLRALTNFPSIQGLHLIGLSITDRGIETLATSFPCLDGVNLGDCRLLTPTGYLALATSSTIKDVGLSFNYISQDDLEFIIVNLTNITRWIISDPSNRLTREPLKNIAEKRQIMILVSDKNRSVRKL